MPTPRRMPTSRVTKPDEPAVPIRDGGLVRLRLDLGYDGTAFSGWARNPAEDVQGVVQSALERIARIAPIELTVAGRTDAGVHATGQVVHCDLAAATGPTSRRRYADWRGSCPPMSGSSDRPGAAGFDARFSALWRRYLYRLTMPRQAPIHSSP